MISYISNFLGAITNGIAQLFNGIKTIFSDAYNYLTGNNNKSPKGVYDASEVAEVSELLDNIDNEELAKLIEEYAVTLYLSNHAMAEAIYLAADKVAKQNLSFNNKDEALDYLALEALEALKSQSKNFELIKFEPSEESSAEERKLFNEVLIDSLRTIAASTDYSELSNVRKKYADFINSMAAHGPQMSAADFKLFMQLNRETIQNFSKEILLATLNDILDPASKKQLQEEALGELFDKPEIAERFQLMFAVFLEQVAANNELVLGKVNSQEPLVFKLLAKDPAEVTPVNLNSYSSKPGNKF